MDVEVRRKIVEEIDSFDATVVSLRHLIANLDAVWNSESWEVGARSAFRREWGKLEEVYATAVERQPARVRVGGYAEPSLGVSSLSRSRSE